MNPLYFLLTFALLATLHFSYTLSAIALWMLTFTQPFALEYFKHLLEKRRK